MMKQEFEEIAGYEVSSEDYNKIIEPMYMALPEVSKQDFVKMLDKKQFAVKHERKHNYKRMLVRNRMGERMTPNGCYYYIQYVDLEEVNIATGKYTVRALSVDELRALAREGKDLDYDYGYDMDYLQCEDTKHNQIKLGFEW